MLTVQNFTEPPAAISKLPRASEHRQLLEPQKRRKYSWAVPWPTAVRATAGHFDCGAAGFTACEKFGECPLKLRIQGESMRVRVSRSELAKLLAGERVEQTIHFAAEAEASLTYALASVRQNTPVRVAYEPGLLTVFLSEEQTRVWGREDEVGIYTSTATGNGRTLEIIIEKDFACLDRSAEDNADTFVNPHAGAAC